MNRPMSPSPRLKTGKSLILGLVGAAALAVAGFAAYKYLFNRPGEAAAMLLPNDADLVVTLDTNPSERQIAVFKKITDGLKEHGIAQKLDDAINGFLNGKPVGAEIRPHLQRSFAMGMWMKDGGSPDTVTLCAIDDPGAVKSALQKFGKESSPGIFKLDDVGAPVVAGVVESYLAISNSETALSRVEKVRSGGASSISKLPEFIEARSALPADANLMVFMSPKVFQTMSKQFGVRGNGRAFETTEWMAYGATVVDEGIAFDYTCPVDTSKMAALRQAAGIKAFDFDKLKALPEGAYGAFAYSQPGRYYDVLTATIDDEPTLKPDFDKGMANFERETGLDIEDDLVGALQGDLIVAVYAGPSGKPEDFDPVLLLTDANGSRPAELARKVRELMVRKSAEANDPLTFVETRIGDATVWEIDPKSREKMMQGLAPGMTPPLAVRPPMDSPATPDGPLPPDVHAPLPGDSTPFAPPVSRTAEPPAFLKGKTLLCAQIGESVLITTSHALLSRALESKGRTLADDASFVTMKEHVVDGSQAILMVNLHRILEAVDQAMGPDAPRSGMGPGDFANLFGDGLMGLVASGKFDGKTAVGRLLLPLDFEKGIEMLGEAMNSGPTHEMPMTAPSATDELPMKVRSG